MINIGTFIWEVFNLITGFFTKLYALISARFDIPNSVINFIEPILQSIDPSYTMPQSISIIGLLAVTGVPIALAIGIYYIFKSPI